MEFQWEEKLFSHCMGVIPEVFIKELFVNIARIPQECFPQLFPRTFYFNSNFNKSKLGEILSKTLEMIPEEFG